MKWEQIRIVTNTLSFLPIFICFEYYKLASVIFFLVFLCQICISSKFYLYNKKDFWWKCCHRWKWWNLCLPASKCWFRRPKLNNVFENYFLTYNCHINVISIYIYPSWIILFKIDKIIMFLFTSGPKSGVTNSDAYSSVSEWLYAIDLPVKMGILYLYCLIL